MNLSAAYLCPVRGVAGLEPPEPAALRRAGRVARQMGLSRLDLPLPEEALIQSPKAVVRYLDGMAAALDAVADAGLSARLIPCATRLLGMIWLAPHLAKPQRSASAEPVFLAGRLRRHQPLDWWADPDLIHKKIRLFREAVSALAGHPGLSGWVLLDRAFDLIRPEAQAAELVLRSLIAEIRERDEAAELTLGLSWTELAIPELVSPLVGLVDLIRLAGLEERPGFSGVKAGLSGDLALAAFLGLMADWLWGRDVEMEVGWGLAGEESRTDDLEEAAQSWGGSDLAGLGWLTLVDPYPQRTAEPPWRLRRNLARSGLLSPDLEPKGWAENLLSSLQ
ncbi:MAG: hypothetical protein JRC92_11690, partial [Deltaproteobacteria bacterium]|nr:hypothetical protein [Deltaproteobacteria bacterium]